MKVTLTAVITLTLISTASAANQRADRLRLADAASEACMSNCSTQASSCKRTCPTTFSTPCLTACDNQAQTCTRSCQAK
jgi:hypothetical protein